MPLTPGLNPAIRQVLPEVEPSADAATDVALPPDDAGSVLTIENDDGSVIISLDGRPLDEPSEAERARDWFANLVDDLRSEEHTSELQSH